MTAAQCNCGLYARCFVHPAAEMKTETPTVVAFPVQVFEGFVPSDLDGDGVDLGPTGRECAGYDAASRYRPRWGGGFEAPRGPRRLAHRAIDVMAAEGALVVAPAPGVVRIGHSDKGGHHAYLDGDDGWRWYLAHMRDEPIVRTGERVEGGELVGLVGRSGNAVRRGRDGKLSGCPHLHLSLTAPHWRKVLGPDGEPVKRRGEKVDPVPFLRPLYEAGGWWRAAASPAHASR